MKFLSNLTLCIVFSGITLTGCNSNRPFPTSSASGLAPTNSFEISSLKFKGKTLNLSELVDGFPYSSFNYDEKNQTLFFMEALEKTTAHTIDLKDASGKAMTLSMGSEIPKIDLSKRTNWRIKYRQTDESYYRISDVGNDEITNVYRFHSKTGVEEKVTNVGYVFGYSFSPDEKLMAYTSRMKDNLRRGKLHIFDFETGTDTVIVKDFPFTWGDPVWNPAGDSLIINYLANNEDRRHMNYAIFDLKGNFSKMTDEKVERSTYSAAGIKSTWLSTDEFLYRNNEKGFNNIYSYNTSTKSNQQLTFFTEDVDSFTVMNFNGQDYIVAITSNPTSNTVHVIDPTKQNKVSSSESFFENLTILGRRGNKLLLKHDSASSPFAISELEIDPMGLKSKTLTPMFSLTKEKSDALTHCDVKKIDYPTFDVDAKTGKRRLIHAFLYQPRFKSEDSDRLAIIESFYGGGNYYSYTSQALCQAGVTVMSPAPRGSTGFGREFEALNDQDLGGNEIIDVIYAGYYLSAKLNLPASKIGLRGGSHGGYATMRLMTFPGEVNGNIANFDWGFGIAVAGFSDIIEFTEFSNIPGWTAKEAGDIINDRARIDDRSPINHTEQMRGSLLLVHGDKDNRVPFAGSQKMYDKLTELGKDVTLVTMEGYGHGFPDKEGKTKYLKSIFQFLEDK